MGNVRRKVECKAEIKNKLIGGKQIFRENIKTEKGKKESGRLSIPELIM